MAKQQDSHPFIDLFTNFGHDLKMPKVDVEAILDHHRKNLEALEQAAKASAAGASSLFSRQREMLQETLTEISTMAQNYKAPGNAQDIVAKQTEFARKSFETAVKNASEVADLVKTSGAESVDILRGRIKSALQEIREGYDKAK